jgi:hypothetical protein
MVVTNIKEEADAPSKAPTIISMRDENITEAVSSRLDPCFE